MRYQPTELPIEVADFLTDRHLATLTTMRRGRPQVTPVGFSYDPDYREGLALARVITWATAVKALNVVAEPAQNVALCQLDGARWLTITGRASVTSDADRVTDAVARYAARYRQPKERPDRVVIEIEVDSVIGQVPRR